ncbi:hypothetical protein [Allomuricauda sp. d1]|uniref:hypothetical protein n=1 Tax=Allomuricauda sp. d1 TaxID=3136725 RepID=UPI0031D23DA4
MATLVLTPEQQIQRLNSILNKVEVLQKLPLNRLITAPNTKSWNVLEVLEHLRIAYSLYDKKIENALVGSPSSNLDSWSFKARPWQRFLIEGQRPKGKKRPFKIKTLKRFEPLLDDKSLSEEASDSIFENFFTAYQLLKSSIVESRQKQMKHRPFASAIGPVVRFYLPEAFEFLICHAERHLVQIEEILASQK